MGYASVLITDPTSAPPFLGQAKRPKGRAEGRGKKEKRAFLLHFPRFFVARRLRRLLLQELWLRRGYSALGNEKKSMLSFCISLVFS